MLTASGRSSRTSLIAARCQAPCQITTALESSGPAPSRAFLGLLPTSSLAPSPSLGKHPRACQLLTAKARGDFTYEGVVVNYLRHILPAAFTAQFTFLYSFHPFKWTTQEVKKLVGEVTCLKYFKCRSSSKLAGAQARAARGFTNKFSVPTWRGRWA